MVNNTMQSNDINMDKQTTPVVPSRPNESGQLQLDDFVRIFDPNTNEILVEKRA